MTGYPGEALSEGADDAPVIVKPFGAAELATAIRRVLDAEAP